MAYRSRISRLKFLIPLTLLVMILVRLVWMQIRTYPIEIQPRAIVTYNYLSSKMDTSCTFEDIDFNVPGIQERVDLSSEEFANTQATTLKEEKSALAWFVSPGFMITALSICGLDYRSLGFLVKLNQWIVVLTVFFATFMVRFLTGSWIISLISATVLLSRGRLLADIGIIGNESWLVLIVTVWATCIAHYLRTCSIFSFIAASLCILIGALYDPAILILGLSLPLLVLMGLPFKNRLRKPILSRLRSINRKMREYVHQNPIIFDEDEGVFSRFSGTVRAMAGQRFYGEGEISQWRPHYGRGGVLRGINMPFALWVYSRKHWRSIVIAGLLVFLACFLVILAIAFWKTKVIGGIDFFELLPKVSLSDPDLTYHWFYLWYSYFFSSIDLHLGLSMIAVAACALTSSADGFMSFKEGAWIWVTTFVLLMLATLASDLLDMSVLSIIKGMDKTEMLLWTLDSHRMVHWMEPVILSLGVAAVFNLLKVLDTWLAEKT